MYDKPIQYLIHFGVTDESGILFQTSNQRFLCVCILTLQMMCLTQMRLRSSSMAMV